MSIYMHNDRERTKAQQVTGICTLFVAVDSCALSPYLQVPVVTSKKSDGHKNEAIGASEVMTNRCLIVGVARVNCSRCNLRVCRNTPVALTSAICW